MIDQLDHMIELTKEDGIKVDAEARNKMVAQIRQGYAAGQVFLVTMKTRVLNMVVKERWKFFWRTHKQEVLTIMAEFQIRTTP